MRTETIEIACYGLFAGLFGLLVWEGWKTRTAVWKDGPNSPKEWKRLREDLQKNGEKKQPDDDQWKYTTRYREWWQAIERANWTGKLPPKPVDPTVDDGPKAPPPPKVLTPLTEILELKTIIANGVDENRIKIQYKDPNVRVPSGSTAALPDAMASAGPATATTTGLPFQDLVAGDPLYPPHETTKFARVDIQGSGAYAVFTRPSPEEEGKTVEDRITLLELGLSGDHVDEKTIANIGGTTTSTSDNEVADASRPWQDPGRYTKMTGQNIWMISKGDTDSLQGDYERILTEDFQIEDWVSRRADKKSGKKMRGVAFGKVSRDAQRFGVRRGDVLIKVNGERVTSRASAIKVGRRQYQRGVRNYKLTFLSNGQEVVRAYRAPDKK